ncbi:hypothetical protein AAY473_006081 [Plecturocebus cupreus]
MGFYHVGQAGLKPLSSGDLPASASKKQQLSTLKTGLFCQPQFLRDYNKQSPSVDPLQTEENVIQLVPSDELGRQAPRLWFVRGVGCATLPYAPATNPLWPQLLKSKG